MKGIPGNITASVPRFAMTLPRTPVRARRFLLAEPQGWGIEHRQAEIRHQLFKESLEAHGFATLRTMMEISENRIWRLPPDEFQRWVQRHAAAPDTESVVASALTRKIAALNLRDRAGVFIDEKPDYSRELARLDPITTLAVLSRRSGPLYLPRRGWHPGLISLKDVPAQLVFPEE